MPRQSISNKVNVYSNKMWSKGLTPSVYILGISEISLNKSILTWPDFNLCSLSVCSSCSMFLCFESLIILMSGSEGTLLQ